MADKPHHLGPVSDHFDGVRFFSPGAEATDRGLSDILRWRFRETRAKWPQRVDIVPARPERHVGGLAVTMVGHASLLIQLAGRNILVDPVWSDRTSPFRFVGPRRVTEPGIRFDDLPPIDAVLLTHNHYDHLDLATLLRLQPRHRPRLVAPLGNRALLGRVAPAGTMTELDWHDATAVGEVRATLVPAHHWSARGIGDRRKALWGGYVLEGEGRRVYLAGDTGYGDGAIFRDVGRRYGAPDLAILPIGAYEPRWFMKAQHVNPEEAVRIFQDVGAKRAVGVHWGTFQLTDESRLAPKEGLDAATAAAGLAPDRFVAFEPGQVVQV